MRVKCVGCGAITYFSDRVTFEDMECPNCGRQWLMNITPEKPEAKEEQSCTLVGQYPAYITMMRYREDRKNDA